MRVDNKCFNKRNHYKDTPLLTLLRYKSATIHTSAFDNVFTALLKTSNLYRGFKSHDLTLTATEIAGKLTTSQNKALVKFAPKKELKSPLLSEGFVNAMEGDSAVFRRRKFSFLRPKGFDSLYRFNRQGFDQETSLHVAARNGHVEYLKKLLSHKDGRKSVDILNRYKQTPLMCAAYAGALECVEILLKHDANAECVDAYGYKAIFWAAKGEGSLPTVKLLLENGVRIDILKNERESILELAWKANNKGVVDYLINEKIMPKKIAGYPLCALAAISNFPDLIKMLKLRDYDVNDVSSKTGTTALMFAARNGNVESAKKLLELGANVDAHNNNGKSAIYLTCSRNAKESCAHTDMGKAEAKIAAVLACEMKKKAADIPFDNMVKAYIIFQENGFIDSAAIIKSCIRRDEKNND